MQKMEKHQTNRSNSKTKYPNLKLLYLSSRIYGGYANTPLNPGTYAYESGFSIKWLIKEWGLKETAVYYIMVQIPTSWLSWGPYLWANGVKQKNRWIGMESNRFWNRWNTSI